MKWMMCLGFAAMLVGGCDSSKQELESDKATLANLSKERDDLKTQLTTMQQQLATLNADLAKAKTASATASAKPATAAKTAAPATAAKPAKAKHHKS